MLFNHFNASDLFRNSCPALNLSHSASQSFLWFCRLPSIMISLACPSPCCTSYRFQGRQSPSYQSLIIYFPQPQDQSYPSYPSQGHYPSFPSWARFPSFPSQDQNYPSFPFLGLCFPSFPFQDHYPSSHSFVTQFPSFQAQIIHCPSCPFQARFPSFPSQDQSYPSFPFLGLCFPSFPFQDQCCPSCQSQGPQTPFVPFYLDLKFQSFQVWAYEFPSFSLFPFIFPFLPQSSQQVHQCLLILQCLAQNSQIFYVKRICNLQLVGNLSHKYSYKRQRSLLQQVTCSIPLCLRIAGEWLLSEENRLQFDLYLYMICCGEVYCEGEL